MNPEFFSNGHGLFGKVDAVDHGGVLGRNSLIDTFGMEESGAGLLIAPLYASSILLCD